MTNNQESSMRLNDQVAIITGVSDAGQVGFALARAFAREGSLLASAPALSRSRHGYIRDTYVGFCKSRRS